MILILGAGAIGSNVAEMLACDLKGEHEITVMDFDIVEERNIRAGTQFYNSDCLEMSKVDALEYMIYKMRNRKIIPLNEKLTYDVMRKYINFKAFNLIIDCLDNERARELAQRIHIETDNPVLHVGFSDQMTFAIEWAENYKVPTDITSGMDICELQGAASFVKIVASLASLVAQEFINNKQQREFIGNRLVIKEIK